ncbi:hypothetical protein HK100_009680 [Physocladia obscura]|uniref:Protein kinase domain-containing protein n=1 Tax=Physocladia obscura TaxID=109957 RepID=A0AAD5SN48_9FUNG|nr:hypothetical protein HK100_009680 [Physocladia obscura]
MTRNIEQEVEILRAVKHPCIISIGTVYNLPKSINIVMEFAKGGELFDRIIEKTNFSEQESKIIMIQLLTALKYLHQRSIVHRDLKPENILLVSKNPSDLRIKISDFGLAKLIPSQQFLKTLCGTPNYVAPEVLKPGNAKGRNNKGDLRAYGSAVDLWSSGVVMYILLVGQPPFSDELAPPSMMDQIKLGKYSFPSPWWDTISPQAIDLIKKLIRVNPDERLTASQALEHPWFQEGDTAAIWSNPAIKQLPQSSDHTYTPDDTVFQNSENIRAAVELGLKTDPQVQQQPAVTPTKKIRAARVLASGDVTPLEDEKDGRLLGGNGIMGGGSGSATTAETSPATPTKKRKADWDDGNDDNNE